MKASKFLREWRRMCESTRFCKDCQLDDFETCLSAPEQISYEAAERVLKTVEKWSAEHPQKTRLDDLKEKYPDVPLDGKGIPLIRPRALGYCKYKGTCRFCQYFLAPESICWDMPLEGGNEDERD